MYTYYCKECQKEYRRSKPGLGEGYVCYNCVQGDRRPTKAVYRTYTKYDGKKVQKKFTSRYHADVWELTEKNDLTRVKGIEKREWKKYELDHIVPISFGRKHNISPERLADLSNLQILTYERNRSKKNRVTPKAENLLREWGYEDLIP
jgi:5-methylcytosine-specific restriction endonuclease McrA